MTCIVGLIDDDGRVYIGGDSAGVGGYSLTIRKDRKVFHNGGYLFGATTSFRMLQLLRFAFTPPVYDSTVDLERFMATTFIDAVRECLKSGGYAQKNNEQESAGHFLVGIAGHLFTIDADYQVGESLDGYDAVGCGEDVALGVLYATPTLKPLIRLELALAGAERHSAGVRGPFYVEVLEPLEAKHE
jgi:hypothetical protein